MSNYWVQIRDERGLGHKYIAKRVNVKTKKGQYVWDKRLFTNKQEAIHSGETIK